MESASSKTVMVQPTHTRTGIRKGFVALMTFGGQNRVGEGKTRGEALEELAAHIKTLEAAGVVE